MSVRLLADENIAAPLVSMLRNEGFDVTYIAELRPGMTDEEVLGLAYAEGRIVLTEDRGFGEMAFRLQRPAIGILLLRLPAADRTQWPRVTKLLREHAASLRGAFSVITSDRFRTRPLHQS